MTLDKLDKQIKDGNLNGIYIFYGENTFLIDSNIKKIKKIFGEIIKGINYIDIDENNINNLISDIGTPAFGYEKKLIIVKNSNLFKKETKIKKIGSSNLQSSIKNYIEENIENINSGVILIFYEDKVEKNELYQIIEKYGCICNFENLNSNDLIKYLKNLCNAYGVSISDSSIKYFIEIVGTDMQECINEIRKLIEYSGKGRNNY